MSKKKYVRRTVTWEGRRYEVRAETEREAVEKLAVLKEQLRRGEMTPGGDMTVNAWFAEWMETYKAPSGITEKSLAMYREKYNGYIRPRIGTMKLKDVKPVHLQRILNAEAGRSKSHVSHLQTVMREIFGKARTTRLILYDPSEDLILPETTVGKRRSITDEERAHILAVAEDHPAGLWVLTILYAGLRPGETIPLIWKDIDFKANEIRIYKAAESGTDAVKNPKTEAGFRDVPIHAALLPRLRAAQGDPFSPVFTSIRGKPLTSSSAKDLWRSFKRALAAHMGHPPADDLVPYCLRHTFCTDLQRAGVPINVAKELMGHSDIAITANIYTHKDQKTLHDNVEKMSAVGNPVGLFSEKSATH